MKKYPLIMESLYNQPHAITRGKLEEISAVFERRLHNIAVDDGDEFEPAEGPQVYYVGRSGERFGADDLAAGRGQGGIIAVVPLFGVMMQHALMDDSGGTSTVEIGRILDELDADPDVAVIVLEIHSPGGQIWGTAELADKLYKIREAGRTKTVSIANSLAASAALYVGSAAGEFVSTPGGDLGSIGVLNIHVDYSGFEENIGIKTTLIAIPEEKIEGHPYAPLPDDVRARIESENTAAYKTFVNAVAKHRGTTAADVAENYGGGRMLMAADALAAGLIDRIITMDQLVDELARGLDGGPAGRPGRSGRGNKNRLTLAEAVGLKSRLGS